MVEIELTSSDLRELEESERKYAGMNEPSFLEKAGSAIGNLFSATKPEASFQYEVDRAKEDMRETYEEEFFDREVEIPDWMPAVRSTGEDLLDFEIDWGSFWSDESEPGRKATIQNPKSIYMDTAATAQQIGGGIMRLGGKAIGWEGLEEAGDYIAARGKAHEELLDELGGVSSVPAQKGLAAVTLPVGKSVLGGAAIEGGYGASLVAGEGGTGEESMVKAIPDAVLGGGIAWIGNKLNDLYGITSADIREKGLSAFTEDFQGYRKQIEHMAKTSAQPVETILDNLANYMDTVTPGKIRQADAVRMAAETSEAPRVKPKFQAADVQDNIAGANQMLEAQQRTRTVREAVQGNPQLLDIFDSNTQKIGNIEVTDWDNVYEMFKDFGLTDDMPTMQRISTYRTLDDIGEVTKRQAGGKSDDLIMAGPRTSGAAQTAAEIMNRVTNWLETNVPGEIGRDARLIRSIRKSLRKGRITPKSIEDELLAEGVKPRSARDMARIIGESDNLDELDNIIDTSSIPSSRTAEELADTSNVTAGREMTEAEALDKIGMRPGFIDTDMALRSGQAATGAAAGAAIDEENPLRGALIGGLAGGAVSPKITREAAGKKFDELLTSPASPMKGILPSNSSAYQITKALEAVDATPRELGETIRALRPGITQGDVSEAIFRSGYEIRSKLIDAIDNADFNAMRTTSVAKWLKKQDLGRGELKHSQIVKFLENYEKANPGGRITKNELSTWAHQNAGAELPIGELPTEKLREYETFISRDFSGGAVPDAEMKAAYQKVLDDAVVEGGLDESWLQFDNAPTAMHLKHRVDILEDRLKYVADKAVEAKARENIKEVRRLEELNAPRTPEEQGYHVGFKEYDPEAVQTNAGAKEQILMSREEYLDTRHLTRSALSQIDSAIYGTRDVTRKVDELANAAKAEDWRLAAQKAHELRSELYKAGDLSPELDAAIDAKLKDYARAEATYQDVVGKRSTGMEGQEGSPVGLELLRREEDYRYGRDQYSSGHFDTAEPYYIRTTEFGDSLVLQELQSDFWAGKKYGHYDMPFEDWVPKALEDALIEAKDIDKKSILIPLNKTGDPTKAPPGMEFRDASSRGRGKSGTTERFYGDTVIREAKKLAEKHGLDYSIVTHGDTDSIKLVLPEGDIKVDLY